MKATVKLAGVSPGGSGGGGTGAFTVNGKLVVLLPLPAVPATVRV